MIVLVVLLRLAITFAVLAFAAWMAVWHVPTVIADPENFFAWFWLAFGAGTIVANFGYQGES